MTKEQILSINRERLEAWAKELADAHATPVILVGVGHDEKSGDLKLVTLDGFDERMLASYAALAADVLREGAHIKFGGL